ncbi:MAG: LuxR C-terminal-related transcriptional regulator [Ignavibacteria bacterium]|jgi:DNA-binding NarL/FixJ family response regulator
MNYEAVVIYFLMVFVFLLIAFVIVQLILERRDKNKYRDESLKSYADNKALTVALTSVLTTQQFVSTPIVEAVERLPENIEYENLTPRQMELLKLKIKFLSEKEIAEMMCISINTVKRHTTEVYRKLNINPSLGNPVIQLSAIAKSKGWDTE